VGIVNNRLLTLEFFLNSWINFVERASRCFDVARRNAFAFTRLCVANSKVRNPAQAFGWKRMQESGGFATIGDLATEERIVPSYLTQSSG
jgi:hypothetical protein